MAQYIRLKIKPHSYFRIANLAVLKAFAASFARAGAKALYLTGRSIASLEETKKLVLSLNPSVTLVTKAVDVCDELQIIELFEEIKLEHGKADVLINNAGCNKGGPIGTTSITNIWTDFVRLHDFET
jgi:NADP-dependent 3-hydroxy acid dehydrogenase YdfG